ncbi:hypothetical protein [Brevundimonas sp.]|uniref:hypothetical protein n=1 Tax=Brevundimonas sp. TaxID=1871086 RepID=UPI00272FDCCB|nr:hypothetical protein [Brevundimonas sp.]MDP1913224.1 hypothetical protein [Brevundimonas sp.]
MTTDASGAAHDNAARMAPPAPGPLLQALLAALNDDGGRLFAEQMGDGGGTTLIKSLLAQSRLSPEQQSVVDLLTAFDASGKATRSGGSREDSDIVDIEPLAERDAGAPAGRLADWRELRDLRQLNDTLAGALGACRVCWGGDTSCDVCDGRGRAGFAKPDLELFDELVAPALRRVLTMRRAGRSDPYRSRR